MEKIRNYDIGDLKRADRLMRQSLHKAPQQSILKLETLKWTESKKFSLVNDITNQMYEVHKEWVNKKLEPSISYLQRQEKREITEKVLKQHFKTGLEEAVKLLSSKTKEYDVQDAITSYTGNFIMMLRTCEKLGVNPNSAYMLAQKSHSIDKNTLIKLFKENKDLPQVVIERAALKNNPILLDSYRTFKELKKNTQNRMRMQSDYIPDDTDWFIPQSIRISMRHESEHDTSLFNKKNKIGEHAKQDGFQIENVPALRQEHGNWCGYTSLAMVLQYYGYKQITPEKIFTHLNGAYDYWLEYLSPSKGPSIDALAAIAQELTPLKARILTEKDYADIKDRNPSLATPDDVLHAYIKGKKPCIIRQPGHFKVVTGHDPQKDIYTVNDPLHGRVNEKGKAFRATWAAAENNYPRDSRHLMLVIFEQKKKI